MTTSATTIYELDRDAIIKAALRKITRLAKGQTPDSEDLANGMLALNALIALYQTLGMPLWKRKDYSLTLVAGTNSYTFGVGQTINTPFPLKLYDANLLHSSGSQQEVRIMADSEFGQLNTTTTGLPNSCKYQPKVNLGVLTLWPIPDATTAANYTLELTYQSPFEGFTSATETPDFPQEWQLPLIYGLAADLAPEYGVPVTDRDRLEKKATQFLEMAMSGAMEDASLFIVPGDM